MRNRFLGCRLALPILVGLGLIGAAAAVTPPVSQGSFAVGAPLLPAAMCGYSCRGGGGYVPGPPSVCYERGLTFCGPSRGRDGPPPASPDRSTSYAPDRRYWRFYRSDGSCAVYVHRQTGKRRTFCDE